MSGGDWYYSQGDTREGPVSRETVEQLISRGVIRAQTLIWGEGMADWTPAAEVFGLDMTVPSTPPASPWEARDRTTDASNIKIDRLVSNINEGSQPERQDKWQPPPKDARMGAARKDTVAASDRGKRKAARRAPADTKPSARHLTFFEAIRRGYGNFATFRGRASRSEFWKFVGFFMLVNLLLNGSLTGVVDGMSSGSVFGSIFVIATIIPLIASAVRRLHDTGLSGLWLLLNFLPAIGTIITLILLARSPTDGDNKYGPEPGRQG